MWAKKITGKPYAGKLHVRFDEGKRMRGVKIYSDLCILFLLYWFKKPSSKNEVQKTRFKNEDADEI